MGEVVSVIPRIKRFFVTEEASGKILGSSPSKIIASNEARSESRKQKTNIRLSKTEEIFKYRQTERSNRQKKLQNTRSF